MKRNLISVIILALCIINFIMLAIIVFTVIPTNKKTDNLITSIASIIDLSVENSGEEEAKKVDLADIDVYTLEDDIQVTLKADEKGEAHYAMVQVAIQMNKKSDDFKTYDKSSDTGIGSKASVIKSTIDGVLSKYTAQECSDNKEAITKECAQAVKDLFNSDVIYDVTFSKYVVS